MRRDEWARLAAPFPVHALDWCVAQLDREASAVRVEPIVGEAAIRGRLDEVLGAEGWSMRLLPVGADALVCEISLLGVTKSAVARSFDGLVDLPRVAGFALGRAAAQLGLCPPATEAAWVEIDVDTGELLYPPEVGAEDGAGDLAAAGGAVGVGAAADPEAEAGSRTAAGAAPERGPVDGAMGASAAGLATDADGAARSRGQRAIERLVDRLRLEGLGRDAAALVVQHGGYGRSAEEARELYRKLRELLLERGTPS